jgi:NAD(P) transhydrogenase subunit alpha
MKIGVAAERFPGERRVALVPATIPLLKKAGLDVLVETGAGREAGFPDAVYQDKGAQIVASRSGVLNAADVILQVRTAGAGGDQGRADVWKPGQIVIGMADPLGAPEGVRELASRGVTVFALELIPRITRAQSMDVLSSMATIAGYKAVVLAAGSLPRMFPLLTTAAGTITPAHVFVVGVGVAGLQAISTSRRLGAVVEAYDVRPAVKEQVQSVGAKFVELGLETGQAEDTGGYAKAQDESFYQRQREMMARVVAANDVVITTAVVPGKKAPILVTAEMVRGMAPGSVVVDLAAERGGNCELTRADQIIVDQGVTILGPTNLPSTVPYHASQMYAKNITTFLLHLVKDGHVRVEMSDEITRDTLIAEGGDVVHPRIREILGLPGLVNAGT